MMFYPTDPNEMYGLFALRLGKYKAHFYTRGTKSFMYTICWDQDHARLIIQAELMCFWFLLVHVCASGASHSSTTPDQDCSVFAGLKFHDPPLIFNLVADPSEHYPLQLEGKPDLQALLERIKKVKEQFEASMVFGESQISKGTDPILAPCCNPQCSPKPECCHCWRDKFSQLLMDSWRYCLDFTSNVWKHKMWCRFWIIWWCIATVWTTTLYCSYWEEIVQSVSSMRKLFSLC